MDVLILDDEPLARQRRARMVNKIEDYQVVAQVGDTPAALQAIANYDPDVVLLDVRMPGEDGLSAAHKIGALEDPPTIIFCTAFDQYALDAFGTEAVGYLLKPVGAEQLLAVLEKARRPNKLQRREKPGNPTQPGRNHLSAKTPRGIELIPLDDIYYFLADQKYVTVYHAGGEHLLDETLKELEQEFAERFLRSHRSALVAVDQIQAMKRTPQGQYELQLVNSDRRIPVSRRHARAIKEFLQSL